MSRGYIKVTARPGLNLRPNISFVDRARIEADVLCFATNADTQTGDFATNATLMQKTDTCKHNPGGKRA